MFDDGGLVWVPTGTWDVSPGDVPEHERPCYAVITSAEAGYYGDTLIEHAKARWCPFCGEPLELCGHQHGDLTCDNPKGHDDGSEDAAAHGATLPKGLRVNW